MFNFNNGSNNRTPEIRPEIFFSDYLTDEELRVYYVINAFSESKIWHGRNKIAMMTGKNRMAIDRIIRQLCNKKVIVIGEAGVCYVSPVPAAAIDRYQALFCKVNISERLDYREVMKYVKQAVGGDISIGFAKEICSKYKYDEITTAVDELQRQLNSGLVLRKGVGAWLRSALERGFKSDTLPKKVVKKSDPETERKKRIIQSLYLS